MIVIINLTNKIGLDYFSLCKGKATMYRNGGVCNFGGWRMFSVG